MSKAKGAGLKEQVPLMILFGLVLGADPAPSLEQDLKSLDVAKLTPLSPEVISRQATSNIGATGFCRRRLQIA